MFLEENTHPSTGESHARCDLKIHLQPLLAIDNDLEQIYCGITNLPKKKRGVSAPLFEIFQSDERTSQEMKFPENLRRVRVCLSCRTQGFKESVQAFRVSCNR